MDIKTKNVVSLLLSIAGAAGTIATAIVARKAAIKERTMFEIDHDAKRIDSTSLSTKEKLVMIGPIYIPTIVVGAITIASILGSNLMSRRAQASMMSVAILADRGWKKYKHQVKSKLGISAHEDILSGIAKKQFVSDVKTVDNDSRELYFDEIAGFFKANPVDLAYAYAEINEMLNSEYRTQLRDDVDFVTISRFLDLAKAELIDQKTISRTTLNTWGWSKEYLSELSEGWTWIRLTLIEEEAPSDADEIMYPFKVLSWSVEPILLDYEDMYDDALSLADISVEEIDQSIYGKKLLRKNNRRTNGQ